MTSVPHSGAKSVAPGGSVAGGHTDGPWLTQWEHDGDESIWSRDGGMHMIATCHAEDDDRAIPVKANARLIAAAPDLLKTLEDLRDWLALLAIADADDVFRSAPERFDEIQAAITKATAGETRDAEPIHRRDGDEG